MYSWSSEHDLLLASTKVRFNRKELEAGVTIVRKSTNPTKMIRAYYMEALKNYKGSNRQIQYQIDHLEARIACSVIEGINAIRNGRTE